MSAPFSAFLFIGPLCCMVSFSAGMEYYPHFHIFMSHRLSWWRPCIIVKTKQKEKKENCAFSPLFTISLLKKNFSFYLRVKTDLIPTNKVEWCCLLTSGFTCCICFSAQQQTPKHVMSCHVIEIQNNFEIEL